MPKIVVHSLLVEEFDTDFERKIIESYGFEMCYVPDNDKERFYEEIKNADGIVIADGKITGEHIDSLTNCKVIVRSGIGYDSTDLIRAKERGIAVCNVPDYCVDEVSDYALALILNTLRHVNTYDKHVRNGVWDIHSVHRITGFPQMRSCRKLTLGIFGFGKIGRLVAQKAYAFGFKMLAADPYADNVAGKEYGVIMTDFDTLLMKSDIVSINAPLTEETRNKFNLDAFKRMKPAAYLVNTARGALVNEEDLYIALRDKVIAGAAIDTTVEEPLPADHPLFSLDNIIITPHTAFFTEDSLFELRKRSCEEACRVVMGEAPESRVN